MQFPYWLLTFCGANQWTGFYMIMASVLKGLSLLFMLCYLCENSETTAYMKPVSHPEEIWGQHFQLLVWSTFPKISTILLIYIVLHIFSHFFSAVKDILLNRTQGSSLFTSEIYHTQISLFFSSSFLGTNFGCP